MCLCLRIDGACSAHRMEPLTAPRPEPSQGRRKWEPFPHAPDRPHWVSSLDGTPSSHPSFPVPLASWTLFWLLLPLVPPQALGLSPRLVHTVKAPAPHITWGPAPLPTALLFPVSSSLAQERLRRANSVSICGNVSLLFPTGRIPRAALSLGPGGLRWGAPPASPSSLCPLGPTDPLVSIERLVAGRRDLISHSLFFTKTHNTSPAASALLCSVKDSEEIKRSLFSLQCKSPCKLFLLPPPRPFPSPFPPLSFFFSSL